MKRRKCGAQYTRGTTGMCPDCYREYKRKFDDRIRTQEKNARILRDLCRPEVVK